MADDTKVQTESESRVGLILAAIAAAALLLFVFQNTDDAPVDFLWFTWTMPLFLLIFITVALTLVVSVIAAWVLNRRSRRR